MMKMQSPDELQPERLQSADAESGVLSILLNFPAAFDTVSDRLKTEHFATPWYRLVYAELCRQMATGQGCDIITIADALNGSVSLEQMHALSQSHDHSARGIEKMVGIVVDRYKSRQLHALSGTMATLAFGTSPVQDRIDQAQAELSKLDDAADVDDWVGSHEAAIEHLALIERREAGELPGIATGFYDLDEMLDGGMQPGNLVVIGARPSMGKTAIALGIALHIAQTHAVGFMSMEMTRAELSDRKCAYLGSIPLGHIKRPQQGLAYDRVVESVERSRDLKLFVSDKSGLNILQVRSRARALKRRFGLQVLMLDYLQLMSGLDSKQNRNAQIEEISRGLKSLAKELGIVVIALSQINRAGAENAIHPPTIANLRDSGAIEQDADVIGLLHRAYQGDPGVGEEFKNYALLRVGKNRQGRCGDINLSYLGEQTRFGSWSGQVPTLKSQAKGGRREL